MHFKDNLIDGLNFVILRFAAQEYGFEIDR